MHIHERHSVCICIMTRRTKDIGVPNCHSNRKLAILIQSSHFTPFWSISMPRTLTNSSYRLNTTDFQFTQYHPQTLNMKSDQKLSPTLDMVGVMVRSIFFTCFVTVQPRTHTPKYSHSHSATCWTQEMTFNSFLHCPKHGQLRDA